MRLTRMRNAAIYIVNFEDSNAQGMIVLWREGNVYRTEIFINGNSVDMIIQATRQGTLESSKQTLAEAMAERRR